MARRGRIATLASCLVVAVAALGFVAGVGGASAPRGSAPRGPFAWLAQTSSPPGWTVLDGATRVGPLPVPPGFHAVPGDPGTLSVARLGPGGTYLGYLNATPIEGSERLHEWPEFRLDHLRDDDTRSVREVAAVQYVRTDTGVRSCVVDDYVTTIGAHHFHEVACLVVRNSAASVIVAATPTRDPAHVWPDLERAVASYPIRQ